MRRLPLLVGLLAAPAVAQEAAPPPATNQTGPAAASAMDVLLQQGRRWLAEGRADLAALSVQRALAAEPRNPAALLLGVRVEAARSNREAAGAYVTRLRNAQAPGDMLASADNELRASSIDRGAVEQARRLSREGNSEQAAAAYRAAFGNREPPSQFAREYYEALAATSAGRAAGQQGLSRLAAQPGADDRLLLANAEQLTYNPTSRGAGIQRLAELAAKPSVGADAQRAWKQALGFYGNDATAAPLYEAYLRRYPDDAEARQRLEATRMAGSRAEAAPGDALRRAAYQNLENGRLRESAQGFESALALNPADADALGGLGIIRLRENRPGDARPLLEKAIAANPANASRWGRALDAAHYPLELAEARRALQRGNGEAAAAMARQAASRQVDDVADAENLLGEAALKRGDRTEAEQHFRAALSRRPGFALAVAGLAKAQGRSVAPPEAPAAARSEAPAGRSTREVEGLREEAARVLEPRAAVSLLRTAAAQAPSDPWVRLDLARALRRDGQDAEARTVMSAVAGLARPDASYAAALFAQEAGRPDEAEQYLSHIPARRRTAEITRLQAQLKNEAEVTRVVAHYASAPAASREQLLQLAGRTDPTGKTAAEAIRALHRTGDTASAARAGQIAATVNPHAGAQLALAGALFEVGLDADAASAMARAEQGPLDVAQQRDLAALRSGMAIRTSDRLNAAGNQSAAYNALRPVLATGATPAAQLALARLYQGSNRPAEAQQVAEAVLRRSPGDWDARNGAVEAALAAGDKARAETLANDAQTLKPGDSRATLLQAKVARASGRETQARMLLAQAATQRAQELGSTASAAELRSSPIPDNPFDGTVGATPNPSLPQDSVSRQIADEMRIARQDTAPRIVGAGIFRSRSGTAGLDSLTEVGASVGVSGALGRVPGQFSAQVTPVVLSSGSAAPGSYGARQFGTNPLYTLAPGAGTATAAGVGLGVGYHLNDSTSADIGTSPLGFALTNVVGGLEYAPKLTDNLKLRVRAERRSVTDSLISYAGTRDPVTGQVWGGVTQTGGKAQLEASLGAGSAYILGGYSVMNGTHVASNARREAGAGLSYPLLRRGDATLTAGLDLVYFGYENNQRSFTYGQGGYFSPQNFMGINVPIDYSSSIGNLRYKVGGTIGFAHFREDPSAIFPVDANLQARLARAEQGKVAVATRSAGQTKNGLTGGVRVELDYPLTEQLSLIGAARYDRAADFQEMQASVRLENRF